MLVAYIKPTNYCNVGCSHCYLPESLRSDKQRMTADGVRMAASLLSDMAKMRGESVNIIWHGGEPLTVPPDWYEDAGLILDASIPGHTESIQTSLIPYRNEFTALIHARYGGGVGSSIDFSQRKIRDSVEEYHRLWMEKVELARQDGVTVVPGTVPTRNEVDRAGELLQWFADRGFDEFNIDRYNRYGAHYIDCPSNREHSRFLSGLASAAFDMLERTGKAPLINVVITGLRGVMYGLSGDRWGASCQRQFIVIEPDGSLNTCPDRAGLERPHANLRDGVAAFVNSPARRGWIRLQEAGHRNSACHQCDYAEWCKSGCPITANPDDGDECSGYRGYLNHLRLELARRPEIIQAYLERAGHIRHVEAA